MDTHNLIVVMKIEIVEVVDIMVEVQVEILEQEVAVDLPLFLAI